MPALEHYTRLRSLFAEEPSLHDAAYRARLLDAQRDMQQCVEDGSWRTSPLVEPFTPAFVDAVSSGGTIVDVGAHLGFYTCLADAHLPASGGRIIAIEPDPVRCALLRALFESNDHVEVIEAALGAKRGQATIVKPRGCSATMAPVEGEPFETPVITLDDLMDGAPVDVIKMDIEGAEADAFDGMRRVIAQQRTTIFLELHGWVDTIRPGGRVLMETLLHEQDYRLFHPHADGLVPTDRLHGHRCLMPSDRAAARERGAS